MFLQTNEYQKNIQSIKIKTHLHHLLKKKNKIENKLILNSNKKKKINKQHFYKSN